MAGRSQAREPLSSSLGQSLGRTLVSEERDPALSHASSQRENRTNMREAHAIAV